MLLLSLNVELTCVNTFHRLSSEQALISIGSIYYL